MDSNCWESAKQWYVEWSPWIAGGLILFNAAFFAGVLSVGAGQFLTDSAVIGWAGAAGSFAAALAAVGIAVHGSSARRKGLALAGKIHAMSLPTLLLDYGPRIHTVIDALRDRQQDTNLKMMAIFLREAAAPLNAIDIEKLYCFNKKLAGYTLMAREAPTAVASILDLAQPDTDLGSQLKLLETASLAGKSVLHRTGKIREELVLGT